MNLVVLVGRVVKDAELKVLNNANQTNVIKFTVAVDREYKDKNGEKITDFLPVEFIGKNLTKLASFVTKGKQIGINGSINIDKVNENYYTKIKANKLELLGTNNSNNDQKVMENGANDTKNSQLIPMEDDDVPF